MENLTITIRKSAKQTLRTACFVAVTIFINNNIVAQSSSSNFGIEINSSISGSGFGIIYTPGIYYKINQCRLSLGANIHKRDLYTSGMFANFEYKLTSDSKERYRYSEDTKLELFTFVSLRYYNNAVLCKSTINRELEMAPNCNMDLNKMKLTVVEGYTGFGLKLKLIERLKWINSIGVGAYSTISDNKCAFRESNSISLSLNTGLLFDL